MAVNQAVEAHLGDCRGTESLPGPTQVDAAVSNYEMFVFKSFLEKVGGSAGTTAVNPVSRRQFLLPRCDVASQFRGQTLKNLGFHSRLM